MQGRLDWHLGSTMAALGQHMWACSTWETRCQTKCTVRNWIWALWASLLVLSRTRLTAWALQLEVLKVSAGRPCKHVRTLCLNGLYFQQLWIETAACRIFSIGTGVCILAIEVLDRLFPDFSFFFVPAQDNDASFGGLKTRHLKTWILLKKTIELMRTSPTALPPVQQRSQYPCRVLLSSSLVASLALKRLHRLDINAHAGWDVAGHGSRGWQHERVWQKPQIHCWVFFCFCCLYKSGMWISCFLLCALLRAIKSENRISVHFEGCFDVETPHLIFRYRRWYLQACHAGTCPGGHRPGSRCLCGGLLTGSNVGGLTCHV